MFVSPRPYNPTGGSRLTIREWRLQVCLPILCKRRRMQPLKADRLFFSDESSRMLVGCDGRVEPQSDGQPPRVSDENPEAPVESAGTESADGLLPHIFDMLRLECH